jgi:hypothetical protein
MDAVQSRAYPSCSLLRCLLAQTYFMTFALTMMSLLSRISYILRMAQATLAKLYRALGELQDARSAASASLPDAPGKEESQLSGVEATAADWESACAIVLGAGLPLELPVRSKCGYSISPSFLSRSVLSVSLAAPTAVLQRVRRRHPATGSRCWQEETLRSGRPGRCALQTMTISF